MEVKISNDFAKSSLTVNYFVDQENDKDEVNFLEDLTFRQHLINDMEAVKDPIHPANVYEIIVGTGTGGLVAFGLVGGNKVGNIHHKRKRMTIDECIQTYCTKTKIKFKKSLLHSLQSHVPA